MLRYNFFATQINDNNKSYEDEVLKVIDEYIERNKQHTFKKASGLGNADMLQWAIRKTLARDSEMMLKVFNVIKTPRGEGMLGNSIDLRSDLFEHLFGLMDVTESEIQAAQANLPPLRKGLNVHTSRIGSDKFFVNDNSPRMRAMLAVVEEKLTARARAEAALRM